MAGRRLRRAPRDARDRRDAPEPARPGLRDLREPGVRPRRARRRPQPRERADAAEEEPVRARRDPHAGRPGSRRPRRGARRAAHGLGAHRPLPPAERDGAARARRGGGGRTAHGVGARGHRAAPGALRADRAGELRHGRRRRRRPRARRRARLSQRAQGGRPRRPRPRRRRRAAVGADAGAPRRGSRCRDRPPGRDRRGDASAALDPAACAAARLQAGSSSGGAMDAMLDGIDATLAANAAWAEEARARESQPRRHSFRRARELAA